MRFANLFGLTIINLFWIDFHYAYPSTSKNSNPTNFRRWLNLLNMDMSSSDKKLLANSIYDMFSFAYDSYLKYGFPYDELNPIDCVGRGYDHEDPDNINVNDALGDYLLTLIDCLDTLAIMGKTEDFRNAVSLVIKHLSFNQKTRVQVFEATIRVLGGLLSAHIIITDPTESFGHLRPPGYDDELLNHAHNLANRMLNALYDTPTGIPYPRFHLDSGLKDNTTTENCLAGAGSLLLEFGSLSALLNDSSYASIARRIVLNLWKKRSSVSGLFGSTIDVDSGEWINRMSGLGAGQDSFFEYLHKAYILFGDNQLGQMFNEALSSIQHHLRTGRPQCLSGSGSPPIYWNVDMSSGNKVNHWIDTLQSVWSGVLVLHGDLNEAICHHAVHYFIWKIYGLPPERYNIMTEKPELYFYPLRPEFAESTYLLYRATKHPFYLHVGKDIMDGINKYTKTECGFATIHNVIDKSKEDRMESFFLSETLKYLYLLFDESNPVNVNEYDYVFSTQAHLFPIKRIQNLVKNLHMNPFSFLNNSQGYEFVKNSSCPNIKLTTSQYPMNDDLWKATGIYVNAKFASLPQYKL
ncbi:ER degradation-enhancing alpha-mannosidase-like protein 1, variant 3 [Schistosoma haematobium]|uniref:alpha-1,2-Mannosidase n=3 Tax=Schistosoma haematobium TaxID=6185 RepID=A0A922LLM7_SCHHA|nr:ER degradation-enhancing alpha-mannosidase-like protein 1, variant 3 [Schistosoma haematobium]KAH9588452.1 ER degradation-enhancing alpha-mannosidase-like protein 1, variant 3 [Schistosoma haematobium]CAH8570751.1 unnamed protein product [Schistosoma haematobium]